MMRRSSLGGRPTASCALDRSRCDAIICSTVCRSIRGACTSPVRTGSSSVRPRAARASELTDNLTAFAVSSTAPRTIAPSSIFVRKVRVLAACPFANFRCSPFSSTQFQKASPSFRRGARSSSAARSQPAQQTRPSADLGARLGLRASRTEAQARHPVDPLGRIHRCEPGRLQLLAVLRALSSLREDGVGDDEGYNTLVWRREQRHFGPGQPRSFPPTYWRS